MEVLDTTWATGIDNRHIFWLITIALVAIALYMFVPSLKEGARRRRLDRILSRFGPEWVSGVVLEDGMDGLVHIDRVVAGPGGLTVVTLVPHEGIIFGADEIEQWTQVVGRRTMKFPNPITLTREGIVAVQYHLPDAPVRGVALFTGESTFPKGKPATALLAEEIPSPVQPLHIPDDVRTSWGRLRDLAGRTAQRYSGQLRMMQPERAVARPILGWLTLAAAGALAAWSLLSQ